MKWCKLLVIIVDWLMSIIAWILFFSYRKAVESNEYSFELILEDRQLLVGLIIIPLVWLFIWYFLGSYDDVIRQSRIKAFYTIIVGTIAGCLGLLFTVIRDDLTLAITSYATSFFAVFICHFIPLATGRLAVLTLIKSLFNRRILSLQGMLISDRGVDLERFGHTKILNQSTSETIETVIRQSEYDDLIIADMHDMLINEKLPLFIGKSEGRALYIHDQEFQKLDFEYDARPLLRSEYLSIKTSPLEPWQRNIKRILDISLSMMVIILFSPLFAWLYYKVKKSSPGPIIYRQERIGQYGNSFMINKFRSMYIGSESDGPQLATKDDTRCTPFGLWMRRWRLDELPQFFNVLKGEMSIVGPRPERPYFTEILIEKNPRYALLLKVRPGITSWGQIKYGYASTIDEMIKRFRYDLLYLDNLSLLLDLRILFYTIIVLFQGKGR